MHNSKRCLAVRIRQHARNCVPAKQPYAVKINLRFAYPTRPFERFGVHIGTDDLARNRLRLRCERRIGSNKNVQPVS